jgi:predicted DNA-binding ribbon-helix-helix protein
MKSHQKRTQNQKLRALSFPGGSKQTSLRLDNITWSAIEFLAARHGIRWQDWACRVLSECPDTPNMASELRQAAFQQLLATVGQGSDMVPLQAYHELLGKSYRRLDDKALSAALKQALVVHRDDSFVSFSVIVGFLADEDRQPFLCVQNRLQGSLHMLATPTAANHAVPGAPS